jgi:hypothetical protein
MVADGRGGHEPDYTRTTDEPIAGWAADAGNTVEDTTNRDGASVEWTLRGPFEADVQRHDHIELFGHDYEIDGEVLRQPGPTGATSHTILRLVRWVG